MENDDSDIFYALCSAYKKIRAIFLPHLLINLIKERYNGSIKSHKYLNNKLSIKTTVLTF